jgi:hypothetical protein
MRKIVRHGDMVMKKVSSDKIKDLEGKSTDKLVIGLGEVTGHQHEVTPLDESTITEYGSGDSDFGNAERDAIYFQVKGSAVVTHEEHNPLTLDEGLWVRINQINYNPFKQELEKVRD